tara:strand:+ start:2125 stop:3003 length:879 start_codon:yes stop_codon:yes gene_type:complete
MKIYPMKLFITGANGTIGTELCKVCYSNDISNKIFVRKNSICNHKYYKEKLVLDDISDINDDDLRGIDVLVHLASSGVDQTKEFDPKEIFDFNVLKSLELLLKAINSGIKKFIIIGSFFEYGKIANLTNNDMSVLDPLIPTSIYAASKAAFTSSCIGLAYSYGVSVYILRPFHVYGENESKNRLYKSLISKIKSGEDFHLTEGSQIRDFSSVEEMATMIFKEIYNIYKENEKKLKIKNLGSGKSMTIYEFAKKIWLDNNAKGKLIKGSLPYRKNESMRSIPNLKVIYEDTVK